MKQIAAIFAHPDDAEIWAGGTLKKHTDMGDVVKSYMFYELNNTRCSEGKNALQILGAEPVFCKTEAYQKPNFETFLKLCNPLPDIIITHWEFDTHIEHVIIFNHCVLLAHHLKRYVKKTPILLMSSTYNLIGKVGVFTPSLIIDISKQIDDKNMAILCHKSQKPELILTDINAQNTIFGKQIKKRFGEGFVEYPLFGYHKTLQRNSLNDFIE